MMAFSLGCFACCVPCDPCTAECSETAVGFEVVWQGNQSAPHMTWTGVTNPINAVPPVGTPYYQQVSASFTLPSDDFPCYARLRFWRNVFDKDGTPSEALSVERVIVRLESGKIADGLYGAEYLSPGQAIVFTSEADAVNYDPKEYIVVTGFMPIALVAALDDQSATATGNELGFIAGCSGTQITATAYIEWTSASIYHSLYGTFKECGEDLPPENPPTADCLDCAGTPSLPPPTVYLTISNFDAATVEDIDGNVVDFNGTYALDISPNAIACLRYFAEVDTGFVWQVPCAEGGGGAGRDKGKIYLSAQPPGPSAGLSSIDLLAGYYPDSPTNFRVVFAPFVLVLDYDEVIDLLCNGATLSGTTNAKWQFQCSAVDTALTASFDWEISW